MMIQSTLPKEEPMKLNHQVKEMEGKRFGRLLVKNYSKTISRNAYWNCLCDCGKSTVVSGVSLRVGNTKSCGCLMKDTNTIHGMDGTPTYKTWQSMKTRCQDPKHKNYKHYGLRGISVCGEWEQFVNFFLDMGVRPEGKFIDRIDNNKGYFKENCQWVTAKENNRKSPRVKLTVDDVAIIKHYLNNTEYSCQKIGDIFGVARQTISSVKFGRSWADIGCIPA